MMIIAGVGMLIGGGLIVVWLLASVMRSPAPAAGHTTGKTTNTRSATLATDADKIAFLAKYLTLPSPVATTEFHIVYHDNAGGGVSGPSDWDIQAVIKVAPQDLPRWTEGMQRAAAGEVDLAWGYALLPHEPRWAVASQPVVYRRAGVIVAVFERDGIVFKRARTT